jgi:hypothetical protein
VGHIAYTRICVYIIYDRHGVYIWRIFECV